MFPPQLEHGRFFQGQSVEEHGLAIALEEDAVGPLSQLQQVVNNSLGILAVANAIYQENALGAFGNHSGTIYKDSRPKRT
jgi:hypothetical protein